MLSRCDRVLGRALLTDAVKASLYVYECSDVLLKVFYLDSGNLIPRSCRFFLLAYHHLASHSPHGTVFVSSWVNFWNRSLRTYVDHEAPDQSTTKIPFASIFPRRLIPSFIPPSIALGIPVINTLPRFWRSGTTWRRRFIARLFCPVGCVCLFFPLSL
ncbi:hypothetical protein LIER_05969 [Lithospermum erythrorhizon]|uniref:Uncharacterized protein n=1 Tax=Lithospermum erythrorhizon TaxID=34254 RepID=A0AAV3P2H8_LITER